MLITLWFYFILILLTVATSIVIVIALHLYPTENYGQKATIIWGRALLKLTGIDLTVQGLENLKPGQAYIFAANHQSQFDIFVLWACMPRKSYWLIKAELFSIPILTHALSSMGSLPIDRTNLQRSIASLNKAAEIARAGNSIVIFPEGTRNATGELLPFKTGGFALAIKSGQPLIPVSISGTRFIQPRGVLRIHPGPVKVVFGRPIETTPFAPNKKQALMKVVREAMAQNYDPDYPYGGGKVVTT